MSSVLANKICLNQTTSGLSILLHGVVSLPDATSYDNKGVNIKNERTSVVH